MWKNGAEEKPADEWYRLCCNKNDGCFMACWNGCRWCGEPYLGEDDHWTSDTVVVDYWLASPFDEKMTCTP